MKLSYPSNKICPCCGTGGYVWYMADSEYVAKCTNCGHYFHEEDFPMCVIDSDPKPKTNANRIRAMSDEELAEKLATYIECDMCPGWPVTCEEKCTKYWLDWLKQEIE